MEMQRKRAAGMLRAALLLVDFEGNSDYLQPCTCAWCSPRDCRKPLYTEKVKHRFPRGGSDLPPREGGEPLRLLVSSAGDGGAEKGWGIAIMYVYRSKT